MSTSVMPQKVWVRSVWNHTEILLKLKSFHPPSDLSLYQPWKVLTLPLSVLVVVGLSAPSSVIQLTATDLMLTCELLFFNKSAHWEATRPERLLLPREQLVPLEMFAEVRLHHASRHGTGVQRPLVRRPPARLGRPLPRRSRSCAAHQSSRL